MVSTLYYTENKGKHTAHGAKEGKKHGDRTGEISKRILAEENGDGVAAE